jgi:hypothetical protein
MANILSMSTDEVGQIGQQVRRVRIVTSDNLSTVTTAGWLSSQVLNNFAQTILPTDMLCIWYGYSSAISPGTFEIFTPSISGSGTITMTQWANPGDVLLPVTGGDFAVFNGTTGQIKDAGYLPSNAAKTNVVMANGATIANHIATYTDTAGTVGEDAATAINGGNIQAGLSGTAGTVGSFPSAATSGELILAAVTNSSGNFNTTISNASAVAQSQVVSIPDSGSATANFIISKSGGTQHITSGSLQVDAGTLISGISTGGQVGTIQLFPTTTTTGSLSWQATPNTGNTATIFTTAAYGQASTITYPDPGVASARGILAPAALVSGNLVSASGTAGNIQDAGILAANIQLNTVNISLNQAAVQGAFGAPFQLIAPPGSGKVILVTYAAIYTNFQTSAFANGGVSIVQYDSTVHGAGTNALAATIPAAEITAAASQLYSLNGQTAGVLTAVTNKGIFFSNQTGAFTGGSASSTVIISLNYIVVTATI